MVHNFFFVVTCYHHHLLTYGWNMEFILPWLLSTTTHHEDYKEDCINQCANYTLSH